MMIGYGHLIKAVLFALSVYWCKETLGRMPQDIKDFKSPKDESIRPVILLYWALTALAIFFILSFFLMLVRMVREGLML
jgi:hypothetical protein